jgi:hypothetical protein
MSAGETLFSFFSSTTHAVNEYEHLKFLHGELFDLRACILSEN